ncbi:phage head closure protein [Caldanaerobacter sp.]|uniref:phage head closure protein n=1 Tax=Caldanaerobacter sp. TaxID=2930036 RepID=UPI003C78A9FC
MNIGELRHRITIQQPVESSNTFGEVEKTWQDVATVWASIEPLRGREYFNSQQINAEVTTQIRIRYRPGIKPKMRVVYGERIFDIQSVIDVEERHKEIHLMCKEVV